MSKRLWIYPFRNNVRSPANSTFNLPFQAKSRIDLAEKFKQVKQDEIDKEDLTTCYSMLHSINLVITSFVVCVHVWNAQLFKLK